jgi:hypothetical protein
VTGNVMGFFIVEEEAGEIISGRWGKRLGR